jgi:nucleoside phosphorylase
MINTGCAGALCPTLVTGAVVCGSALVAGDNPDLSRYVTHPALTSALCQAGVSAGFRPVTEAILTTREPLLTPGRKAEAFASSAAVAVEMEGAAIAQAATEAGVEVASVRVILDDATTSLPVSRSQSKTMFDFARNVACATLSVEEVTRFSVTARNVLVVDGVLGKLFKSVLRPNV